MMMKYIFIIRTLLTDQSTYCKSTDIEIVHLQYIWIHNSSPIRDSKNRKSLMDKISLLVSGQ